MSRQDLTSDQLYEGECVDQLRCALCRRRFSDAKVLPCLHTFCRRCLEVSGGVGRVREDKGGLGRVRVG